MTGGEQNKKGTTLKQGEKGALVQNRKSVRNRVVPFEKSKSSTAK